MKCCELTAGMLRNNIKIERRSQVADGSGGDTTTWATHKTMKAYIKPKSGNEYFQSMRLEARTTHDIWITYVSDILPSDRINFNGRYFQIRLILNLEERNRWLQIVGEEGVAQ